MTRIFKQTDKRIIYIYIYRVDQKSWWIELGPNVLENDFWLKKIYKIIFVQSTYVILK